MCVTVTQRRVPGEWVVICLCGPAQTESGLPKHCVRMATALPGPSGVDISSNGSLLSCVCDGDEVKDSWGMGGHVRVWTCSDRVRAAKALCRSGVDWPRRYLVCQDKVARHAPLGMRGTAGRGRATRPSAGRGTRGAGSEESNPQRTLMGRPRLTRQSLSRSLSLSRPPPPLSFHTHPSSPPQPALKLGPGSGCRAGPSQASRPSRPEGAHRRPGRPAPGRPATACDRNCAEPVQ